MSKTETRPMPQKGGHGRGPMGPGMKPKKGTIKRMMTYVAEYKLKLILVVLCILISSGASVASSLFIQTLIDGYVTPMLIEANPDFAGLAKVLTAMAVIFLTGTLAAFFYNRTMAIIAQSTLKDIRDEMFEKMQDFPVKYFDQRTHGDVMSHFTNDADTLRQMISQSLPNLFSSIVSMIAVLCSMLYLSVWLTLIVLAFTVLIILSIKFVMGKSAGYFMKMQKSLGDVNGFIEEMINGMRVVKVFCYEQRNIDHFNEKNEDLFKTANIANTLAIITMPIVGNLGYAMYVVIAVVGGAMAIGGMHNLSIGGDAMLTLGTIASFLTLSRNFTNPLGQISQQLNSVIMAMAGASRIFDLLDEKPEEDKGTVTLVNVRMYDEAGRELARDDAFDRAARIVEVTERTGHWAWKRDGELIPMRGKINLTEVDFGYTDDKLVLHDITIYAEPGKKVALVGATGAGKTTITNLINRFYDIDDGKIQYDGININHIKKEDLRRSLGVVLQDVNLFTGTVMENIRYGKLDATDEECIAAAKLANADGFIRMLPDGYDTVLEGDGSGLSQGQRQLISIARAAVADPPVMILDEATSSIDTRTETIVQRGMDNLMHGRTVFVIAHRLSTIQNSDVIMVMENGRIIERGDHDHLIAERGKYYQLYTGAFELE